MPIVGLSELKKRVLQLDTIDNRLDTIGVTTGYIEENRKLTVDDKIPLFVLNPASPMPVAGQKLYRVTSPFPGFRESDPACYLQPPKDCTRQQRCNLPKHPVFYCSDVPAISFFEVIQKRAGIIDEYYYFTEWEVTADRKWRALSFIFSGIPPSNPAYAYVNHIRGEIVKLFAPSYSQAELQDYMEFYHDQFTKDNAHKFSSVVSHQFLYENDKGKGDFVFYPSVQAEQLGNNFAFNERVIDNGEIAIRKVYKIHVHQLTRSSASSIDWSYELMGIGEILGAGLQWRNPTKFDFDEFNMHFPAST